MKLDKFDWFTTGVYLGVGIGFLIHKHYVSAIGLIVTGILLPLSIQYFWVSMVTLPILILVSPAFILVPGLHSISFSRHLLDYIQFILVFLFSVICLTRDLYERHKNKKYIIMDLL